MPRHLSLKQTRRCICLLLIAAGMLVLVWRVSVHVTAQTSTTIFSDDFNSTTRNTAKWNVGVLHLPSEAYDPKVTVTQGTQLTIKPLTNASTWSHNGYVSVAAFNMTGARATVEVPQVTTGGAYTILALSIVRTWSRARRIPQASHTTRHSITTGAYVITPQLTRFYLRRAPTV